jgi:hypothetical protein
MHDNVRIGLSGIIAMVPAASLSSYLGLNDSGMSWEGLAIFLVCLWVTYQSLGRWAKKPESKD